jgi:hypothetical protein
MPMTLSGDGTITGLSAGGLPDATVTQAEIASGVAGTGPAFRAYMSAAQTISGSTFTKLNFNTEVFDTNSCYDTTTNRFTPNVAGYYQVSGNIYITATAQIYVYKNGTADSIGPYASTTGFVTNSLVYLNGTTDYVELYIFSSAVTTNVTTAAQSQFSGALVRAA